MYYTEATGVCQVKSLFLATEAQRTQRNNQSLGPLINADERGFWLKMCDSYQHRGGVDRPHKEKIGVFLIKGREGDKFFSFFPTIV